MSNRDRRKPPSQRKGRKGASGADAPCMLCGAPASLLGFWTPTARVARHLGSRAIAYTLCRRCGARPDAMSRVEDSIINHRADEVEPAREPLAAEVDVDALARISDFGGFATVEGEPLPVVLPRADPDDHMEFDRMVCEAGIKKFLRPLTPADQPDSSRRVAGEESPPQFHGSHMLVEELAPGLRRRCGIQIFPEGSLN